MKMSLEVLRIQKLNKDNLGPDRLKVGAASSSGVWQMYFPLEFSRHVYIGQTLEIEVKVGD